MSLWAEFLTHDGRNINKWTHYFPVYERHLERFRNQAVTMIEIGCGRGGSLQLWKRHLGPHARIVGVDILERAKRYEEHQIHVRIGDQSDTQFLQSLIDEFGAPEIVLDDGSHIASHMVSTFQFLYPKTAPTGVYMVEDLHANYSSEFGGGYLRPGTFVELCKTFVDGITAIGSDKVPHDPLIGETLSMHIYEKIAVFEKGRHEPAISLRKGGSRRVLHRPTQHDQFSIVTRGHRKLSVISVRVYLELTFRELNHQVQRWTRVALAHSV